MTTRRQKIQEVKRGEEDRQQALMELRDLTRRFGTIHELQSLQLKLWPRVILPHSTAASVCRLDMKSHLARFEIVTAGRAPGAMRRRLESLDKNVKFLLGDWWRVVIKINGKDVYDGPATQKVDKPREYAGTDFEAGKVVATKPWVFQRGNN